MKLIFSILLMAPFFASAATEIIYNRSANPYVPAQGFVTREHICVDEDNNVLQVLNPEDSTVVTAPRTVEKEVCVQWNRNDSSRPTCVRTIIKDLPLSDLYDQYTFEPSDYRKEHPVSRKTKRIEKCSK